MIRQAQTYLAGAASSAALIGAAVVAFVLIVWLNPLRDLQLPDLGGADALAPVSSGPLPREVASSAFGSQARGDGDRARRASGSAESPAAPRRAEGRATTGPGRDAGGGGAPGEAPTSGPRPPRSSGGGGSGPAAGAPEKAESGLSVGGSNLDSSTVPGAVGGAVGSADQALGGALGQTGVGNAVQGATQGLVGPGSTAGQTIDGALGAANGVLGGGGSP
jgi:hypothetical protein